MTYYVFHDAKMWYLAVIYSIREHFLSCIGSPVYENDNSHPNMYIEIVSQSSVASVFAT